MEIEENQQLLFLEDKLSRKGQSRGHTVYRKPTHGSLFTQTPSITHVHVVIRKLTDDHEHESFINEIKDLE